MVTTRSADSLNVVVIGAGPAGVLAALRAAELGARTTLVTRDDLGGMAAADGPVPVRTLAYAARLFRGAMDLGRYGITSAHRSWTTAGCSHGHQRGGHRRARHVPRFREHIDAGRDAPRAHRDCALRRPPHHRSRQRSQAARRQGHPVCGRHAPAAAGAGRGLVGSHQRRVDADRPCRSRCWSSAPARPASRSRRCSPNSAPGCTLFEAGPRILATEDEDVSRPWRPRSGPPASTYARTSARSRGREDARPGCG